jgi:hypothetical protein
VKSIHTGAARRDESRRGVFLKMGERVKKTFRSVFSLKIGENLSEIFSQNQRNFEGDFLPKSGKFE